MCVCVRVCVCVNVCVSGSVFVCVCVCGQSRTSHLSRAFGAEFEVPLALPPHPHVVTVLHHYAGDTTPFRRHLGLLIPASLDVEVTMASRSTFVVMPVYQGSLKSLAATAASTAECAVPSSPQHRDAVYGGVPNALMSASPEAAVRGMHEREWALVFVQALRTAAFLREHGVAHRDIKSDNWFIDGKERVVLADFGGAISLVRPRSRRPVPFVQKQQAFCCNAMAWDPHVARLSRSGPPDDPDAAEDMTLADVYDKVGHRGSLPQQCGRWQRVMRCTD